MNEPGFEQAAQERLFATAPPHLESFLENTMLFTRTGLALRQDGKTKPLFPISPPILRR
ncbi:MAG: hypothetical protein MO846_00325 [Candidatus Devosia symbiotica]|nr:hypothetical protein [Candidatus Devosia symbiotica]